MRPFIRKYRWVLAGLGLAALVVIFLAPLASSNPDGLDRVSQDKEFADKAEEEGFEILPGYAVPGIDNERLTVVVAGLAGATIVFVVPMALGYMARRSRRDPKP